MLNIPNTNLWLGNASDLRDISSMLNLGITAIIDLAIEQPLPTMPRMTNYCRFVMTDDGENDPATILAAISTATAFANRQHSTAICCNAGLNRSPSIAAATLSRLSSDTPAQCLERIAALKRIDVNPALWNQIVDVLAEMNR